MSLMLMGQEDMPSMAPASTLKLTMISDENENQFFKISDSYLSD